ncbi:MAG: hypothetical protein H6831_00705 [Planctomycetes bacterium]|nr:hypothetical protein [Planctomycetota bacterium]MCB9902904.1 hypothetical protein [Planctomycetota bacterium]
MPTTFYSVLHVFSLLLLSGFTFSAFASPTPERRRNSAILTGVLSLLVLVGGFGLLARTNTGWEVWVLVKLACWLGISAMAGMVFKRPAKAPMLRALTILLFAIAVTMVYVRPFMSDSPADATTTPANASSELPGGN